MTSTRPPLCMRLAKLRLLDDGQGGWLTVEGCRELSTQTKHTLGAIRNLRPVCEAARWHSDPWGDTLQFLADEGFHALD